MNIQAVSLYKTIIFLTPLSITTHTSAMFYDFRLRNAAARNDIPTVMAHIDHGININAQDIDTGNTALHEAINHHHIEMTNILLTHGANQKIKNHTGYLPDKYLVKKRGRTPIEGIVTNKKELTLHADLLCARLNEL
ncbi:MAG TPA: ankyrin repeat domain-containing protein [Candidatus Babeliales bacterium]|jgi:ankyrin repeat protein|nr:ankyrin repeat domain-containing protein [Candidatus Babeliales bacterium]